MLLSGASAHSTQSRVFRKKLEKDAIFSKSSKAKSSKADETGEYESMAGMNTLPTHIAGVDNSFRLLKREGRLIVIYGVCHYVVAFDCSSNSHSTSQLFVHQGSLVKSQSVFVKKYAVPTKLLPNKAKMLS